MWVILMKMKVSQVGRFQITDRWICFSIFFDISFIVLFTRLLPEIFWRKNSILFQLKFQKSVSRCSTLQKIGMSYFVILKWRPYEYKIKMLKNLSTFGAVFSEIRNADILNLSWIKYFGNDFSFLKKMTYIGLLC